MTEWRAIPGFDGYEASETGEIRRLDRRGADGRRLKGRLLKQSDRGDGYLRVSIGLDCELHQLATHRAIALAFHGVPEPGLICCHNDGNKLNNHYKNLRWDTHSENALDIARHGRRIAGLGSPLCAATIERIDDLRKSGATIEAIASWMGFNRKTVMKALGRTGHLSANSLNQLRLN